MATLATPVSAPLEALLEQLGAALTGGPMPSTASLYAQLVRIRDEAVLVEARASARDLQVRRLLAELEAAADRLQRAEADAPGVNTVAVLAGRQSGKTVAIENMLDRAHRGHVPLLVDRCAGGRRCRRQS